MTLIAVRAIDLAIFGTMGSLWIVGAFVIFFVWRWVIRQERAAGVDAGRVAPVVGKIEHAPLQRSLDRLATGTGE